MTTRNRTAPRRRRLRHETHRHSALASTPRTLDTVREHLSIITAVIQTAVNSLSLDENFKGTATALLECAMYPLMDAAVALDRISAAKR
jgi:hypothetical protein